MECYYCSLPSIGYEKLYMSEVLERVHVCKGCAHYNTTVFLHSKHVPANGETYVKRSQWARKASDGTVTIEEY
jgi:protein-arginine kinase activator protein McsA